MAAEPTARWQRRALVTAGLIALLVFGTTWFASERSGVHELGDVAEVLIINDAGPVRIRSLDSLDGEVDAITSGGVVIRSAESWLLQGPDIEQQVTGAAGVFRLTCPGRMPCRASVEIFVPSGVAVSIVAANDQVSVDSFDGALTIFAGDGGVQLGSVAGSVSITTSGPVDGVTLGPTELTVDVVDDHVSLSYLDAPTVVAVLGGEGDVTIELPPGEDYAIDAEGAATSLGIESDLTADRFVSVRSSGSVSIDVSEVEPEG